MPAHAQLWLLAAAGLTAGLAVLVTRIARSRRARATSLAPAPLVLHDVTDFVLTTLAEAKAAQQAAAPHRRAETPDAP